MQTSPSRQRGRSGDWQNYLLWSHPWDARIISFEITEVFAIIILEGSDETFHIFLYDLSSNPCLPIWIGRYINDTACHCCSVWRDRYATYIDRYSDANRIGGQRPVV